MNRPATTGRTRLLQCADLFCGAGGTSRGLSDACRELGAYPIRKAHNAGYCTKGVCVPLHEFERLNPPLNLADIPGIDDLSPPKAPRESVEGVRGG